MTYSVPDIHLVDWKQVTVINLIIHGRFHPIVFDVIYPYNLVNQHFYFNIYEYISVNREAPILLHAM
jgi:hypothetical protein